MLTAFSYLYDATGRKVRKVIRDNVFTQNKVTDYANGFQYLDHVIQHFPTAEGYVSRLNLRQENGVVALLPSTELPVDFFTYVYNYTDHLGNIRLSYAQDPDTQQLKIVEQNHYYPFGLRHTNYSGGKMQVVKEQEFKRMAPTPEELLSYKYKYNGKEWQDELGLNVYDYDNRIYDPALGRFWEIDPKSELGRRWTPYNFCFNNPVYYFDPDGMWPNPFKGLWKAMKETVKSDWKAVKAAVAEKLKKLDNYVRGDGVSLVVDKINQTKDGIVKPDKPKDRSKVKTADVTAVDAINTLAGTDKSPRGKTLKERVDGVNNLHDKSEDASKTTGGNSTVNSTNNSDSEPKVFVKKEEYVASDYGNNKSFVHLHRETDTAVYQSDVEKIDKLNKDRLNAAKQEAKKLNKKRGFE